MGRNFGYGSADHRRRSASILAGLLWDISYVFGRVALGVLILICIIAGLHYFPVLRAKLAPVLPEPVREFFERKEAPVTAEALAKPPPKALRSLVRPEHKGSAHRIMQFGMGSTKLEVLSIQGSPTRRTEDTWSYGDSEVYFTSDRVVGWRSSGAQPLRVR